MATLCVTGILGAIHYSSVLDDAYEEIMLGLDPADVLVVIVGGFYEEGPRRIGAILPINNEALTRLYRHLQGLREQNTELVEFAPGVELKL